MLSPEDGKRQEPRIRSLGQNHKRSVALGRNGGEGTPLEFMDLSQIKKSLNKKPLKAYE